MGPSVDSVLGIDVVSTWQNDTADWDIVRINATNHPDLFWGMLVKPSSPLLCLPVLFLLQLFSVAHAMPAVVLHERLQQLDMIAVQC